ncbi:polysaccharide pyruvyl transferase family protein [Sinorhizobium kostiense]|nr:polysaccharide pyruvyl transferase family protein [Sinorhizobium kostiense]
MPKLGVLTFHRCINYGSFWQARCLIDGLRSLGADPVILDHHSSRVRRAEWRCAFQPLLPARTMASDLPLYSAKIRRFADACRSFPLSRAFELDDPVDLETYESIVVGSDEVWNLRHPWYGGCQLFYGEGLRAQRIVSYAATFGSLTASRGLDRYWADKLQRFDAISVRDENSKGIVESTLGREAALVLDPCLLFPEAIAATRHDAAAAPYVAVYGHSFPRWFQVAVRFWARSRSLPLVSIGYRNDWADAQWIDAGPYEFAGFIADAQAVVTNFFHGCVFSLLNEKPFACVLSDYRSNKVCDLAQTTGAERHLVTEETPQATYATILEEAVEPAIADRLVKLRLQSKGYLDNVLG